MKVGPAREELLYLAIIAGAIMRLVMKRAWLFAALLFIGLPEVGAAQVNVTTWRNDVLRTGQNISETTLTPTNLISSNFGLLCSANVDGQVYAQPLVLSNVTFNGTNYASLVYVVTQNNTLYVFNGTPTPSAPCQEVASLSLTPAGQYATDCHYLGAGQCQTISPTVGALGTPVIQPGTGSVGTLYVVTETQNVASGPPQAWYHYLHVVSLDQMTEIVPPVRIVPPGPLMSLAQNNYWSRHHAQRPGLLLVGNNLFIGFSMMDGPAPLPNGALFSYDVTNLSAPPLYFATTANATQGGGGIWQGGAGLAYGPDESGSNYIYVTTGNGAWDGQTNFATSFLKIVPGTLQIAVSQQKQLFFTPADEYYRNCATSPKYYTDLDFGSGGVVLTPSNSNWPYLALSADKEGAIFAIDRGDPGEFNQGGCLNECPPTGKACSHATQDAANQNIQTVWLAQTRSFHNNPAYWNNYIYGAPDNGYIYQFQICNNYGPPGAQPLCESPVIATGTEGQALTTVYGASPSVSASAESGDAIVWLIAGDINAQSTTAGQLFALDALSMDQLYVSSGVGSPCPQVDTLAPATKFSVPTIANGYVYLGTQQILQNGVNNGAGTFYIFGLNRQCNVNAHKSGIQKKSRGR